MLDRAARLAAALRGSSADRAKIVRALVGQVIVDEKTIVIKVRRSVVLGGNAGASGESDGTIELPATIEFKRRGTETKLLLPGVAEQNHGSRCDPVLIKRSHVGGRGLRSWPPAAPDRFRKWPSVRAPADATSGASSAWHS